MAKNNRNNRGNQQMRTPTPAPVPAEETLKETTQAPEADTQPSEESTDMETPSNIEVIEDEATVKHTPAPDPVDTQEGGDDGFTEEASTSVFEVQQGDDENVVRLKNLLSAFVEAQQSSAKNPENFPAAARLAATLTSHLIKFPRPHMLDLFAAFVEAHKDDVADPKTFMRGSTLLNTTEEQQVGFLFNLFYDLACKRVVNVNVPFVSTKLGGKAEFGSYYNRRIKGIQASAQ